MKNRNEFDFPQAIQEWGWKFHHLGILTDDIKANENYLDHLKFSVSGFNDSPAQKTLLSLLKALTLDFPAVLFHIEPNWLGRTLF